MSVDFFGLLVILEITQKENFVYLNLLLFNIKVLHFLSKLYKAQ